MEAGVTVITLITFAGLPRTEGPHGVASYSTCRESKRNRIDGRSLSVDLLLVCTGQGSGGDPSFFFTPLSVGQTAKSVDYTSPLRWSTFAMGFYDNSAVALEYTGLDPAKTYEAHVVFNAEAEPVARLHAAPRTGLALARSQKAGRIKQMWVISLRPDFVDPSNVTVTEGPHVMGRDSRRVNEIELTATL